MKLIKAGAAVPAEDRKFRALVFAASGSGKTHLGAMIPGAVILSLEVQGYDTIEYANADATVYAPGEGVPVVSSLAEIGAFLKAAHAGELPEWVTTIVLDGITEAQAMLISQYADDNGDVSIRGWGLIGRRTVNLLRALRDLPYDLLVTARLDWRTEGQEGATKRYAYPLVKGSVQKDIGGYFNAVGYLYRKQHDPDPEVEGDDGVRRYILLDGAERYAVKPFRDLTGVVVPDFAKLAQVVRGQLSADDVRMPDAPLPDEDTGRTKRKGGGVTGGRRKFGDDNDDNDDNNND